MRARVIPATVTNHNTSSCTSGKLGRGLEGGDGGQRITSSLSTLPSSRRITRRACAAMSCS
jgi:hypothetical protein